MRNSLAFRHFVIIFNIIQVNIELSLKFELLKSYCRKDNLVEDCLFTLAKLVLNNCSMLVSLIGEVCDAGEDILMKGTKWNILNNIKKE